jgi:ABC-type molybdate transport system substrate-binding protein
LNEAGKSGPAVLFARNKMCALARPGLAVDSANLLALMLVPDVKLATSTPKADPSGDYALEVFRTAEAIMPGAQARLGNKALQLTGSSSSAVPPPGRIAYGWHVAQGRADIFLTYCTNAAAAQKQYPGQKSVMLPDALTVAADYGLTVMKDTPAGAHAFAQFALSSTGQDIPAGHGFTPVTSQDIKR